MFGLRTGPTVKQFLIVVVANFTLFHTGLSLGWLSPVLVKISNQNQTALHEPITEDEGAWVVSTSLLSGLAGMPFGGYLANNFGRKFTLVIFCLPRLVSYILLLFATESWMLIFARALCGVSDLMQVSVTATYFSEMASKQIRGALGTLSQIQSALGAMFMLGIGPYVSFHSLNIIHICLFVGTAVPLLFLPETPYFLYSKGRKDESKKLLIYLRGSEDLAREEMLEYASVDQSKIVIRQMFRDRVILKTLTKVIILATCFELIGYNSVGYYLQTVLNSTQVNIESEISSLLIGCIQLIACFCTLFLTDRLGRKPVLVITLLGMTVGMAGLGTFFQKKVKLKESLIEITGFLNYLPLISIALLMFSFNAGIGSIMWTLIAELFDGPLRAIALSTAVFTTCFFAFLLTKYFPPMIANFGSANTYYTFSGFCIFTALFVKFAFNETKGKTFSEIQMDMGRDVIHIENLPEGNIRNTRLPQNDQEMDRYV